jgi:hypothetical protein
MNMEEHKEHIAYPDDEDDLNTALDIRYVIGGLLLMAISLPVMIFLGNQTIKIICAVCFFASFFIITRRRKVKTNVNSVHVNDPKADLNE